MNDLIDRNVELELASTIQFGTGYDVGKSPEGYRPAGGKRSSGTPECNLRASDWVSGFCKIFEEPSLRCMRSKME